MNELALQLFSITGDQSHLRLAIYFEHPNFLQKLVAGEEALSGRHANYHIPVCHPQKSILDGEEWQAYALLDYRWWWELRCAMRCLERNTHEKRPKVL